MARRAWLDVRACAAVVLSAGVLVGCPLDNRPLGPYTSGSSAGEGSAAGADAGQAGSSGAGSTAGVGGTGTSGAAGDAGSGQAGNAGAGTAGTDADASIAGDASGGAGSGGGGSAGQNSGGSSGASAASGSAGASICPDLNQNSVPDCQESLVPNAAFDSDDSGWQAEADVGQSWNATDAHARALSGSLSVQNTLALTGAGLVFRGSDSCILITGGSNYRFMAELMIASGQDVSASGAINVEFHDNLYCGGAALSAATSNVPVAVDTWSVLSGTVAAPASALSMKVRLVALKAFDAEPVTVLFDDVLVAAE